MAMPSAVLGLQRMAGNQGVDALLSEEPEAEGEASPVRDALMLDENLSADVEPKEWR